MGAESLMSITRTYLEEKLGEGRTLWVQGHLYRPASNFLFPLSF